MSKYIETYPDSITLGAGIISSLSASKTISWAILDTVVKQNLERAYGIRSGFKHLSSFFTMVPEEHRAEMLESVYGEKWRKLWEVFKLSYSPLDAYKVIESGTNKKDITGNNKTTFGHTITEDGTDSGKVGNSGHNTSNGSDSVYGFNSIDAVPSDKKINDQTTEMTETRDLTATRNTEHGGLDSTDTVENEQGEYSLEKSGNIGYTTPQELLKQEFELWIRPYFDIVFEDIDSLITIKVYD